MKITMSSRDWSLILVLLAVGYAVGGFLTNAYCQTYRWKDWSDEKLASYSRSDTTDMILTSDVDHAEQCANNKTFIATAMWPGYWLSRFCLWVVQEEPAEHAYETTTIREISFGTHTSLR